MKRTIITPLNTAIHLSIPQKYVGKRIEITFFDLDEMDDKTPSNTPKKLSELSGQLSAETAEEMQKYVTEGRIDWEVRLKKQI